MNAIADADNNNPALDFFDRLGNPIPYRDTPDNKNEDDAGYLAGVEEYDNQMEPQGVVRPDQKVFPGVATPDQEENSRSSNTRRGRGNYRGGHTRRRR